jgi:NAD(P)H-nitrite reductase large subunit
MLPSPKSIESKLMRESMEDYLFGVASALLRRKLNHVGVKRRINRLKTYCMIRRLIIRQPFPKNPLS